MIHNNHQFFASHNYTKPPSFLHSKTQTPSQVLPHFLLPRHKNAIFKCCADSAPGVGFWAGGNGGGIGAGVKRYSFDGSGRRRGKAVAIIWFRNDLRILDNEVLYKAWVSSEAVLPVYCVDPRLFGATHYFGFPKTGARRAQFLIECLSDLRRSLMKRGLNLLIQHGKPEQILPSLAKSYRAHTIYAQKETCSEELRVERLISKNLEKVTKLELIWGCTIYHIDDLPFSCDSLLNIYTQFRKSVESKSVIRSCIKIPAFLGPAPNIKDWGIIPEVSACGLQFEKVAKGLAFVGGESAALSRVHEYFWKKDLLRVYKATRNGMLGPDYSTKFSPWLASGSLSPRFIYEEVKRDEKQSIK